MSFKVRIKNFQIIEDASLDFIEGLNVIVGPSNNGKSSIFRAIDTAIFNKPSTNKVQVGKDSCTVGIIYNGNKVIWKRSVNADSKTAYQVNGKVLVKVGKGQPDEVKEALNISEIVMLKSKEKLNFWKQMKFPLLLDKTPSQLYEFMALSSEEDNLTQIIQGMREDLKEVSNKQKRLEGAIDIITTTFNDEKQKYLAKRDGDMIVTTILDADADINKLRNLTELYKRNVDSYKSMKQATTKLEELSVVVNTLDEPLNRMSSLVDKSKEIESLFYSILDSRDKARLNMAEMAKIEAIISEITNAQLDESIDNLELTRTKINDLSHSIDVLTGIELEIKDLSDKKVKIESAIEGYPHITSLIKDYTEMSEKISSLTKLYNEMEGLSKIINDTEDNIKRIDIHIKEKEDELGTFDVCPLCSKPLR